MMKNLVVNAMHMDTKCYLSRSSIPYTCHLNGSYSENNMERLLIYHKLWHQWFNDDNFLFCGGNWMYDFLSYNTYHELQYDDDYFYIIYFIVVFIIHSIFDSVLCGKYTRNMSSKFYGITKYSSHGIIYFIPWLASKTVKIHFIWKAK